MKNRKLAQVVTTMILSVVFAWNLGVWIAERTWPVETSAPDRWGLPANPPTEPAPGENHTSEIIVAVIDTGVDVEHPNLAVALWTNPGESGTVNSPSCRKSPPRSLPPECDRARNGVDDDENGLIDDVHGWNFADGTANLEDRNGHGTHVTGIIAGRRTTRNGDFQGVAPHARVMILKYCDPDSPRTARDAVEATALAVDYAVRMGAHVINYSGGGSRPSERERAAILRAAAHGVLFVAAAGNERSNSDLRAYYPADYDLPNILSVAAIDPQFEIPTFSNWGPKSVAIAAQGRRILSTLPGGGLGFLSGTSQATAFASGAAALAWAREPNLARDPERLIAKLGASADRAPSLEGKTRFEGAVNASRLLAMQGREVDATGIPIEPGGDSQTPVFAFAETNQVTAR